MLTGFIHSESAVVQLTAELRAGQSAASLTATQLIEERDRLLREVDATTASLRETESRAAHLEALVEEQQQEAAAVAATHEEERSDAHFAQQQVIPSVILRLGPD